MEGLFLLIGSIGLVALLDLAGFGWGADSRDGIGDDHQRPTWEVS